MWTSSLKIAKNGNFWYKFSPKGVYPFNRFFFTKFCLGEGVPGLHSHAKFHHCIFKTVALRSQKSPKMVMFFVKYAPLGKFWGWIGKLEYRCTTTNLPLCNDTIIVLTITVLNSISVITNFVIRKRDK